MARPSPESRENLDVDIFVRIEDAHERIDGLLEAFRDRLGAPRTESLRARLDRALLRTMEAEERSLYAHLDPANPRVREALQQHRHIERLLHELGTVEEASERWTRRAHSLIWAVEIHFQLEESEVFDLARETWEGAEPRELGARFATDIEG